jgi:hypothetical protein
MTIKGFLVAPDEGSWVYEVSSSRVQLVKVVIGESVAVPSNARAGKPLSVAFVVTRSDDGGMPSGATISVTTKVGAASIPNTQSLNGATAVVNVLVPTGAKGKLLTVTVRISLHGQTTTKIVSFRVA